MLRYTHGGVKGQNYRYIIFVARDFQGYQGVQKSSATAFLGLSKGLLWSDFPEWLLSRSAFLDKKLLAPNMEYLPDASMEFNG